MPLSFEQIEAALLQALPQSTPETEPARSRLLNAMHGAVSNGGKRLRVRLVLESAHVASTHGGHTLNIHDILPAACAIEFIHAYSLVHDDLPAMDDSATRRGRPSCHVEFGEATAILVGDALLTTAFELLTQLPHEICRQALRASALLARAAGEAGMVGGQMIDIAWSNASERDGERPTISGEELLDMHALKTGALIRAACEMGAVLGGGDDAVVLALAGYGTQLGRAFQLKDDLLDVEGDPSKTGKDATDTANDKITAPAFFGIEKTREMASTASEAALHMLDGFGSEANALRELARFAVERDK